MKDIHFPGSAFYAGLACLLEKNSIQSEDYLLALDFRLPYIFLKDKGGYRAGFMVEDLSHINAHLRKYSLHLVRSQEFSQSPCVIRKTSGRYFLCEEQGGVYTVSGLQRAFPSRHACSAEELRKNFENCCFFRLSEGRADCSPISPRESLAALSLLECSLLSFGEKEQNSSVIRLFQQTHFHALLAEGIFMMKLLGRSSAERVLQKLLMQYNELLRCEKKIPFTVLSAELLRTAITDWKRLIEREGAKRIG